MIRAILTLFAILLAAIVHSSRAQLVPGAPVEDFRMPAFNEEGVKTLEIRGREARSEGEDRVNIVDLSLLVYDPEKSGAPDTTITSPFALLDLEMLEASGPESLRVKSEGYRIEGEEWIYRHRENRLTIRKNVRVTFRDTVRDYLK